MPDCLTTRRPDALGGTRVPVRYLFNWLESGETLERFLDSYTSVSRASDGGVATSGRRIGKGRA
ncbi:MAG: DUF433 domain-containing protein [Gammaproteobacteria bacterium]|nr:DUF433 domain-containing protein [Gammaproteobacteria bacterium]